MTVLSCRIPVEIELRGPPGDDQLDNLEDALAAVIAERLAQANREIASREDWPYFARRYMAPEIEFALGHVSEMLRGLVTAAIEAGLQRALSSVPAGKGSAPAISAPRARRPRWLTAPKPASGVPWSVLLDVPFHIRPRDFLQLFAASVHSTNADLDLSEVYFDLLDERRPAVAWVIELNQEFDLHTLLTDVEASYSAKRHPDGLNFAVGGDRTTRQSFAAVDLDKVIANGIPDFSNQGLVNNRPATGGASQTVLSAGAWIFFAFMALPRMDIGAIVEFGQPTSILMKVRDLEGLVAALDFLADMNFSLGPIESHVPDATVTIWITPFLVRQKINSHSLAALIGEERHKKYGVRRLGRVVPLSDIAGQPNLPGAVRAALSTLPPAVDAKLKPSAGIKAGFWQPGARGASLSFVFPADLPKRRLGDEKREAIEQHFQEVKRILALEDTFLNSGERTQELGRYIDKWSNVSQPLLFELLLDRLSEVGLVDEFFDAVRNLGVFDGSRRRTVIRLASEGSYASRKSFNDLVAYMNARVADVNKYGYNFANQTVLIDGTAVSAAGSNATGDAGVIFATIPFFSESARSYELRPEAIERLKAPVEDYIMKYMGTKVCGGSEELTGDALMQKAVQYAAEHASPPIGERDVKSVEVILSVRIIKIEECIENGVTETRVTFQDVRKIGDQSWVPAGAVRRATAYEFESRLTIFTVKHEMELLTIVALGETALLGGVFIIELGIASLLELAIFVSFEVICYWWRTPAEERTIEGYLTAVLKAELQLVGFKVAAGFAKGASQLLTRGLLSTELITNASAKWILFGLRGTLTAAGFGAMGVLEQFATDLVNYSHCGGWSKASVYWDRFSSGFIMGMLFEFVAVPFLSPPLRRLIEKASNKWEVVKALRLTGKSYAEISRLLVEGTEQFEIAMGRTIERTEGKVLSKGFGDKISEIWREYQTSAFGSLLELYGQDLSAAGARGLRRLLGAAGEAEADRFVQAVLRAKGSPSAVLAALEEIDTALLGDLAKSGQLTGLATSPRTLKVLSSGGKAGVRLLTGPFKSSVRGFEDFLVKLEELPAQAREDVVGALLEPHPLPPDLLLKVARDLGALDEEALSLLGRLHGAGVDATTLFSGSAVPFRSFAEEFNRFGEEIQTAALKDASGKSPQEVLKRARTLEADAIAKADAEAAGDAEAATGELEGSPEFEGPPEPAPGQAAEGTEGAPAKPTRKTRGKGKPRQKKPSEPKPPKAARQPKPKTIKPPKEPKLPKSTRPAPVILDPAAAARGRARIAWLNKQRELQIELRNIAQQERVELINKLRRNKTLALGGGDETQLQLKRIAERRARRGITPEDIEELDRLAEEVKEIDSLREEIAQRNSLIQHYGSVATPAEIEKINQAGRRIARLLRSNGPNYAKLSDVTFDQILGAKRWELRKDAKGKFPALENDHIVSVKRITNLPEISDLLAIYAKASETQQAEIVDGIRAIGDRPTNLRRMQAEANGLKLERSWHEISPIEMREFGYTQEDIDAMIRDEDLSLAEIKDEIARMTREQHAKL